MVQDFGDGVSYNKYTAAYMDAKEGGAGDFQKTIPFKNAECGAVSDVHKPVSTLKTLPPGYNSLPSVKQATMGDDMGDHTALSVKHGHSNVFTSEDDETMYTRTMANLEKTRKVRSMTWTLLRALLLPWVSGEYFVARCVEGCAQDDSQFVAEAACACFWRRQGDMSCA